MFINPSLPLASSLGPSGLAETEAWKVHKVIGSEDEQQKEEKRQNLLEPVWLKKKKKKNGKR